MTDRDIPRSRRPLLLLFAMLLCFVMGWGGMANGCNTVTYYRSPTYVPPPLDASGPDAEAQEQMGKLLEARAEAYDHSRRTKLPLAIANFLLSGLLTWGASRALREGSGGRSLALQAVVANAALSVADFALSHAFRSEMALAVMNHFPRSTMHGTEGMSDQQVGEVLVAGTTAMFVGELVLSLAVYGLATIALTRPATRAYLEERSSPADAGA